MLEARQIIILTLLISLASSAVHEAKFESNHIEVEKGDTVIVLIDALDSRKGLVDFSGIIKCISKFTNEFTHVNSQDIVIDGKTTRTKEAFIFSDIQSKFFF